MSEGYWLVAADGGVFTYGRRRSLKYGSNGALALERNRSLPWRQHPMAAATGLSPPTGASSLSATLRSTAPPARWRLFKPIVGHGAHSRTARATGWCASDGGIFSFGDAQFYGSTGAIALNDPIVAMAPTPDGRGYWLVASDGGIFTFGDAAFYGSTAADAPTRSGREDRAHFLGQRATGLRTRTARCTSSGSAQGRLAAAA